MTKRIDHEHWSRVADQWIEWARAPNHDAFWAYRDALMAFLGRGEGDALDIGCGEGRISATLKACGYKVMATDPVAAMLDAARHAGSADDYAIASGDNLPFPDASFDLVMAYNVLMDVADVPATLKEIRRVLRPTGQLVVSIVHPFTDRGAFATDEAASAFVVPGSYFGLDRFEDVEERNGRRMQFAGWSMPLEAYARALEDAGLAITAIREPVPLATDRWAHMQRWARVPLYLWWKARPLP